MREVRQDVRHQVAVAHVDRERVNILALRPLLWASEGNMGEVHGRRKAVGCHVFAGGFSGGIQQHFDVTHHLERHGFGLETSHKVWGVENVIDCEPHDWPRIQGDVLFGNPRCTGFSCVTAGYSSEGHGPWARQCQDIHDLMGYALGHYPIIVWESVQQAYTVGKPLLDIITQQALSLGYRIAHVFVNAAMLGNCQQRKRYFYVAYPREKRFNVSVPEDMHPYYPVLYDAIWDMRLRETTPWDRRSDEYTRDSYARLSDDDWAAIPHLPTGWGLNTLARYDYARLTDRQKGKWDLRNSDMPFSMHCIYRLPWLRPCQTLQSSSGRLVHPWHNRTLTIGELAEIMGWGDKIPIGHDPVHQLAKGVVPAVGAWLAEQALACLNDDWGDEEWTVDDIKDGVFRGQDSKGMDEKVIDVTRYVGQHFDVERYSSEVMHQHHRYNVDPCTGKLIKSWKDTVQGTIGRL